MLRCNNVLRNCCNALERRVSFGRLAKHNLGHPRCITWSRTFAYTTKRPDDSGKVPGWQRYERARAETASHRPVSIEEFQKLADDGDATIDHAKACLWHKRQELDSLTREQKRVALGNDGTQDGVRVLRWILKQAESQHEELSRDRLLTELVCWFLVPEEQEEYIWRWLDIAFQHHFDPLVTDKGVHVWGGQWLGSLATASSEWANSPVGALRCFRRAAITFEKYRSKKHSGVMTGIKTATWTAIENHKCEPYDPEDFDFFIDAYARLMPKVIAREDIPAIKLWHPTNPDPHPWVLLLRRDPSFINEVFTAARPAKRNAVSGCCTRAAYMLELQGFPQDAAWLLEIVRTRTPNVWAARPRQLREVVQDPKLEVLRQQAVSR